MIDDSRTWAAPIAALLGIAPGDGWEQKAACRGADPDLFSPLMDGERTRHGYPERARLAVAYCVRCPVLAECRAAAESRKDQGVWASQWRAAPDAARRVVDVPPSPAAARAS